jgi:FkbM family methyltransferase
MSYKRTIARLLDRPGGRWVLAKMASPYLRKALRADLDVAHVNGLWTHRIGSTFFPDGRKFESVYSNLGLWKTQAQEYTSQTRDFWLKHYVPKQGDVIIDVGAGRGEDTLTFSHAVGNTGRVIAIEANPLSFAMLETLCLLNGAANVKALQFALMDKPGTVRLVEDESSWTEDSIVRGDESVGIEVQSTTLDQIWQQEGLKEVAFLKMNIEGGERHALLGMESVFPYVSHICVACHDFRSDSGDGEHFRTRAFVQQFLAKRGFLVTSNAGDPRAYVRDHIFGTK